MIEFLGKFMLRLGLSVAIGMILLFLAIYSNAFGMLFLFICVIYVISEIGEYIMKVLKLQ